VYNNEGLHPRLSQFVPPALKRAVFKTCVLGSYGDSYSALAKMIAVALPSAVCERQST
jgi:hypothetical protein